MLKKALKMHSHQIWTFYVLLFSTEVGKAQLEAQSTTYAIA